MKIDKNSYAEIIIISLVATILIVLSILFIPLKALSYTLAAIFFVLMSFIIYFHRVPKRESVGTEEVVAAVADGKIVIVEKVFEKEYLKKDCMQVSIYMDFFDVHANYWPMTAEVSYYKYHPGNYHFAYLPKASELNEHSTTALKSPKGEIVFKQIAGTFARRIVCYSEEGLKVQAGEQCGIIKFGSRIDYYLPLDADIKVKLGDYTRACETVIAVL